MCPLPTLPCLAHALNLAVGNSIKRCKYTKDVLHACVHMDVAFEVSKLVKFSPKQAAELEKLKEEYALDSPGFRVLCPTRWTVCIASLKSLLSNNVALQQLWETVKDSTSDPTIKENHWCSITVQDFFLFLWTKPCRACSEAH